MKSHKDKLTELIGIKERDAEIKNERTENTREIILGSRNREGKRNRKKIKEKIKEERDEIKNLDIAIIGVAGRYPDAKNINEFWNNLKAGKDSIKEIPRERWDNSFYYNEDKNTIGKTYSKWGGFIDDVDKFDPLFFNISPKEAEIIDPQERLFLECVYETLEDAGYTRETLGKYNSFGLEGNVGVYVGVMWEEYQLYGAARTDKRKTSYSFRQRIINSKQGIIFL